MATTRASFDIVIYRGDTYVQELQLYEGKDQHDLSKPMDLTGMVFQGMARKNPNETKWFDIPIAVTDVKNGKLEINLDNEQTKNLGKPDSLHSGKFDIQVTKSGRVFTFAVGNVTVTDDFTYTSLSRHAEVF